jgi:hypothetical protein
MRLTQGTVLLLAILILACQPNKGNSVNAHKFKTIKPDNAPVSIRVPSDWLFTWDMSGVEEDEHSTRDVVIHQPDTAMLVYIWIYDYTKGRNRKTNPVPGLEELTRWQEKLAGEDGQFLPMAKEANVEMDNHLFSKATFVGKSGNRFRQLLVTKTDTRAIAIIFESRIADHQAFTTIADSISHSIRILDSKK